MNTPKPLTTDAINFASCALEVALENGGKSDARSPDLEKTEPIDMRQYAKGLISLWMGSQAPSDEPFTDGGKSALDIQAGFALGVAEESFRERGVTS